MASANEESASNLVEENEEFCKIEASVVTGFEECARGEAREKFGVDVQASRGKITWEVPLRRLNEVPTLGSIDNFKVVMHTVRHFNFSDQDDSLGRLQKMIVDIDWESGLRAWRRMFNFPHPVASRPDVIPSPEELVDVVIMTRRPEPKDKADKKKKGKGRKKDKERGKDKKGGGGKAESQEKGEVVVGENLSAGDPGVADVGGKKGDDGSDEVATALEQVDLADGDSVSLKTEEKPLDSTDDAGVVSVESNTEKEKTEESLAGEQKDKEAAVAAPKTVVIKKITSSDVQPEIDIKVIDPSVFPTALRSEELRHLEPMEIDSPNASFRVKSSPSQEGVKDINGVETPDSAVPSDGSAVDSETNGGKEDGDQSEACVERADEAKAFAKSVFNRLSTPPTSPSRAIPTGGACATPPPTPILSLENPFLSLISRPEDPTPPVPVPVPVSTVVQSLEGSSTDPPAYHEILSSTSSQMVLSEPLQPGTDVSSSGTLAAHDSVESKVENGATPESELESVTASENVAAGNVSTDAAAHVPSVESLNKKVSAEETSSLPTPKEANSTEPKDAAPVVVSPVKVVDPTLPKFRVTCNRVGEHRFDSSSAAASFGSAVITYFKWPVDLKKHDIEVLLNIDNEEVSVALALTRASLHNRNLVAFGPTTLRATICYNMLRLSRIRNGDFICDPMCGTAAIPVESALNWTNCYTFGGDMHEKAIERTVKNMAAAQEKALEKKNSHLKLDAVQWNIEHFPLRNACVDVFVSDLPFGHRLGSRTVNRTLYPCLLTEMARTARTGARACLLTEDRTSLIKAIQTVGKFWQRRLVQSVNIGGLSGFVFVLIRTASDFLREDLNQVAAPTQSVVPVNSSGGSVVEIGGVDAAPLTGSDATSAAATDLTSTTGPDPTSAEANAAACVTSISSATQGGGGEIACESVVDQNCGAKVVDVPSEDQVKAEISSSEATPTGDAEK